MRKLLISYLLADSQGEQDEIANVLKSEYGYIVGE